MLAYNLGNLWRRLVLPSRIDSWSLTSLQRRLVKTGGRLVKHARYYWLLLAEGHLIDARPLQGGTYMLGRALITARAGWCRMRPIKGRQIGMSAEWDWELGIGGL